MTSYTNMTVNSASVQAIVISNCNDLLGRMQKENPKADVGISVALYYPGNPLVPEFYQFGLAGPDKVITPQTVYAMGSVTKVFTATLAAYLSVRNVIGDLGETLTAPYLSNFDTSGPSGEYWEDPAGSSFLSFATHTSGMSRTAADQHTFGTPLFMDELPPDSEIDWWTEKGDKFEKHVHDTSHGTPWLYSNEGFVTLGYAVAAAAQSSEWGGGYTQTLDKIIAQSFGMQFTVAGENVPSGAEQATGYNRESKPVSITSASDVKSTAQDMLLLLANLYGAMQLEGQGGTLVPLQHALTQTAKVWKTRLWDWQDQKKLEFEMGLGWQISHATPKKVTILAKDGSTSQGGCSCWVGLTKYAPNVTPAGIVVMTNQVEAHPDGTARTILEQIIELG